MPCSCKKVQHCPSVCLTSPPSVCHNSLASTNINQSAPNLVKMYMTIRSQMSAIIELIGLELSELSALELENSSYLFTL